MHALQIMCPKREVVVTTTLLIFQLTGLKSTVLFQVLYFQLQQKDEEENTEVFMHFVVDS